MPAPLLKVALIATSVSVAAFLALYEEWPQFRAFVDGNREKLAFAFESIGSDFRPPRPSSSRAESDDEQHARRQRREEMARRNAERWTRRAQGKSRSFDDIVGEDGMLKQDLGNPGSSTATEMRQVGLRRRGRSGFERGAAVADPFGDEHEALFDRDLIGVHDEERQSRASTATLAGEKFPLVDVRETAADPLPMEKERKTLWQGSMPGAFGSASETEHLDADMRRAIEQSLLEDAIRRSEREAYEDADMKAAIAASLEDTQAQQDNQSAPDTQRDLIEQQHLLESEDLYADPATESSFYSMPPEAPSATIREFRAEDPPLSIPPMDAFSAPVAGDANAPQSPFTDEEYDIPTPESSPPTSPGFVSDDAISHPASAAAGNDNASVISAAETVSNVGTISEVDSFSEVGVSTPGDWTDVESEADDVSEVGHGAGQ